MSKEIRVRFAPSPTGPLHIGGVRTALFNYLFAKKHGGKFLLRIEDTDQTRFVPGAEEYIIEALNWCGITIDEGVSVGGDHAPYKQSERMDIYKKYAGQLVSADHAYYAFDTPEELNKIRSEYEAEKKTFSYDLHTRDNLNNSLGLSEEELAEKLNSGMPYVIRFKMPADKLVEMKDMIRGDVKINTNTLDDKVLFKSDGLPTYHLANVVDDYLMKISHVIRGEEWLPSLPLHVLLYEALGWTKEAPEFAHLPLILKPTGKGKLSKRDGDKGGFPVFPLEWKNKEEEISSGYREEGYFSDSFINMLAFLGWNPGTEQEVFSMDELIEAFSLERVGKAGARFDPDKAKWFNQQYLQQKDNAELARAFNGILKKKDIDTDIALVEKIVGLIKERAVFIGDLWEQGKYFFEAPTVYDPKIIKKRWKEAIPGALTEIISIIDRCDEFDSIKIEALVKQFISDKELNMGQVMNCLRLSLVGGGFGVHLFDIMEIIGKAETIKRINIALEKIG
ncbi:glutamate--tRNA ligase [Bacteroidales bacterium]|nr:glutamate--tRNA ligase [Bacteroidales bacterium]